MKTNKITVKFTVSKTAKTVLTLTALCLGSQTFAQNAAEAIPAADATHAIKVRPQNFKDAVASLKAQVLTNMDRDTAINPVLANQMVATGWQPSSDIVINSGREGVPEASVGLPIYASQPYSAEELIAQTLTDRDTVGPGARVAYFQDQANIIVQSSGQRADEILLRYTLNRSLDVADHVISIAGRNTDEVQRWITNFFRMNFEMAAGYGNNAVGLRSIMPLPDQGSLDQSAQIKKTMNVADYGREYAQLMWEHSSNLTSGSSKAIIMMRLVGYLGWDINSDLRRREKPLAQTIFDIYTVEHARAYNNILHSFESDCNGRGCEPNDADLAALRSQIKTILDKLPARFQTLKELENAGNANSSTTTLPSRG